jgi:ribosomal protein L37E
VVGHPVATEYSEDDLRAARYLAMLATDQHGYPEPALSGKYLAATFNLEAYCSACGIGKMQAAPFRLKKPPSLRKSIRQLNWVFDEYFVSTGIYETVFKPFGIGCRPIVLHRTGDLIDSVVQLDVPVTVDLEPGRWPSKVCPRCGRRKYAATGLRRDVCPRPNETGMPMFRSKQYFGDGARAFQLVLVSQKLRRVMTLSALEGGRFIPCA